MFRWCSFVFFFALSSSLYSLQYIPMDCTSVINVSLSHRNHNRIGIEGNRIKKVFFRSTDVSIDVEEESGQIFIQALRPNCPSTTISVISSSGEVQELELNFEDCVSEVVLLQPILKASGYTKNVKNCDEVVTNMPVDQTSIQEFVEGFIQGSTPEGYLSIDDPESPISLKKGLKLQRLSRLVNNQQIVFVYRLRNTSHKIKHITECKVNILDGDWVFLDRYELGPDECALVLIGCFR